MFLTLASDGNQVITCIFVNEADIVVDKNEVHCSVTTATNLHILKCKKKTLHFRN